MKALLVLEGDIQYARITSRWVTVAGGIRVTQEGPPPEPRDSSRLSESSPHEWV